MWPRDVAVRIVDVRDAPVQRLVSDQAAGDLNLGKLWHPPVLPSRGPASADVADGRAAHSDGAEAGPAAPNASPRLVRSTVCRSSARACSRKGRIASRATRIS